MHSNYFFSNDSTLYFSFHISIFDRSRKASFTTAVWPEIFLDKTGNTFIFPTVNHKKNSFQPLATLQDWEPAENRKRYT